jgi:hypothetical protein
LTFFTPSTFSATWLARIFASLLSTKPLSCTTPLKVSTEIW